MFKELRASVAPRKLLALLTATTIALGPSVSPAFAASTPGATATPIQHLSLSSRKTSPLIITLEPTPMQRIPGGNHASW